MEYFFIYALILGVVQVLLYLYLDRIKFKKMRWLVFAGLICCYFFIVPFGIPSEVPKAACVPVPPVKFIGSWVGGFIATYMVHFFYVGIQNRKYT